jgi:hypothetical protein
MLTEFKISYANAQPHPTAFAGPHLALRGRPATYGMGTPQESLSRTVDMTWDTPIYHTQKKQRCIISCSNKKVIITIVASFLFEYDRSKFINCTMKNLIYNRRLPLMNCTIKLFFWR